MGNRQSGKSRIHQPYSQMVEDTISALKEHPGSTQNEVFGYLEDKYGGRISPKVKRSLETVIRSTMKSRKRPNRRGGGRQGRPSGRAIPRVRFKSKQTGPVPRRRGRPKAQKKVKLRKPVPRLGKGEDDDLFPSDNSQGPSNSLEEALMGSQSP